MLDFAALDVDQKRPKPAQNHNGDPLLSINMRLRRESADHSTQQRFSLQLSVQPKDKL